MPRKLAWRTSLRSVWWRTGIELLAIDAREIEPGVSLATDNILLRQVVAGSCGGLSLAAARNRLARPSGHGEYAAKFGVAAAAVLAQIVEACLNFGQVAFGGGGVCVDNAFSA